MHFVILGGSGRTGQPLIAQALAGGHSVTALVRRASALSPHPSLTILEGSPTDARAIDRALGTPRTPDAVLTALASAAQQLPFFASTPPEPRYLMADSFQVVADAMEAHGVRRFVILSAQGVGKSWDSLSYVLRPAFTYTKMKWAFDDHNRVEAEARKRVGGVDWVIVKPARLTADTVEREVKINGEDGAGLGIAASTSRASVATFMLAAATEDTWVHQTPVISN